MLAGFLFLSIVPTALANVGIDVSQSVSKEQFECLKDNGYKFVIVRAYRNNGVVDSNSAQTIKNARAAGLEKVDAVLLPCISCGDASQQVIETIDYLKDENARVDMIWLDVEGRWNRNIDVNIQFIDELTQQISSFGIKFGIYTTKSNWVSIMNNSTKFASNSSLWYPHYDNRKSFDGFRAFGGWNEPLIKQYIGDVKECGVILDRNFS